MSNHTVIVGNLGTVVHDGTWKEAKAAFFEYRKLSKANYGRVAGESVTWLRDGDVYFEYVGPLEKEKHDSHGAR